MSKLPFIKFFPRDWLGDDRLRLCSVAARGLWMDMLCLMHSAHRRGYLQTATEAPLPLDQLARCSGCSSEEVSRLISELLSAGVCDCTEDGMIRSRRMMREESKREKCSEAGKKGGGNPAMRNGTLKGHPKGGNKGPPKRNSNPSDAQMLSSSSTTHSSNHREAIGVFCKLWEEVYRERYPFVGGKDGDAIKWILEQIDQDVDRFRGIVGRYLADREVFIVNSRHSLGLLRSQLPKWLTGPPPKVAHKAVLDAPRAEPLFTPKESTSGRSSDRT